MVAREESNEIAQIGMDVSREALGLSTAGLARLLRMQGVHAARTVRRWEAGGQDIPGYAQVILDLALHVPAARNRLGI